MLLPRYPLAPEHPSPTAQRALRRLWDEVGSEQTMLTGESAGGHLALVLALNLRDADSPLPAALGLVSPFLDLDTTRDAAGDLARRGPMLTPAGLAACAEAFAAGAALSDPAITPLNASLHGLPPTLVICGTDELLAPASHGVVAAIRAAGGTASLRMAQGLWHAFPLHAGLLTQADQAVAALAELATGPDRSPSSTDVL